MTDLLATAIAEALRPVVRQELIAALAAQNARPQEPDQLLGIGEAAKALRCSTRSVRRLISVGRLHASKLGPGKSARVLISRSELARFLEDARQ